MFILFTNFLFQNFISYNFFYVYTVFVPFILSFIAKTMFIMFIRTYSNRRFFNLCQLIHLLIVTIAFKVIYCFWHANPLIYLGLRPHPSYPFSLTILHTNHDLTINAVSTTRCGRKPWVCKLSFSR